MLNNIFTYIYDKHKYYMISINNNAIYFNIYDNIYIHSMLMLFYVVISYVIVYYLFSLLLEITKYILYNFTLNSANMSCLN